MAAKSIACKNRLAVEVPSAHDLVAHRPAAFGSEDEGVVGPGVDLHLEDAAAKGDRISCRPMHLRHAAQGIGVLHLVAMLLMRGIDGAPREQGAQVIGHGDLAWVGTHGLDAFAKRALRAEEPLDGHGAADVGELEQVLSAEQGEPSHRADRLGAVHQRQPLLGLEGHGGEPRPLEGGARGQTLTAEEGLTFADEQERQVGQGSEVARGADRTALGHHREHAGVQHRKQEL